MSAGSRRAAFAFIFITVFLDMLAMGIAAPVLPKLITGFQGNNYGSAAHILGYFGFTWALMQFVFSPIMGALSDRFGRKPVAVLSNIGLGLDYIVLALAPSVGWLFLGRVINGITSATFSTASAYIADVTPPEGRAAKFGMLGAAFGLGFVIGPALGGFLGEIDLRLPFWFASGCGLLNGLYGFFVLPESLPPEKRAKFTWRTSHPFGALRMLQAYPVVFGLAIAVLLQRIAHDTLTTLLVLYTDYRYGWTPAMVGALLAGVGVGSMLVAGLLTGPIVKRFGEWRTLTFGMIAGAIGFTIYGLAPTGTLFLIGLPLLSLWGLAGPAMQSLMTARVGPTEQGRLQGSLSSVTSLAGMVSPLFATQSFALAIGPLKSLNLPGLSYLLAAGLVVSALLFAMRTRNAPVPT